jgi:SAM-dependent methyltransferase
MGTTVVSESNLSTVYDHLYRDTDYGKPTGRDQIFREWLFANIDPGATVMDVGCGRGSLIKTLLGKDYSASGIEIADSLFERELRGLPVRKQSALDLDETEAYDVVLSNDMLEHLPTEDDARRAFANICTASKRYVLISVGCFSSKWPTNGMIPDDELHLLIRTPDWWQSFYEERCAALKVQKRGSCFLFGEKKQAIE